uniref:hypothetical protein n=1 Tax=Segatella hominis TaxID=2518605 RepID=UPI00402843D2
MGFDIDLKSLTADDYKFVQNAVKNYDSMKPMILEGDQYRLVSPYEGNHSVIQLFIMKSKKAAKSIIGLLLFLGICISFP